MPSRRSIRSVRLPLRSLLLVLGCLGLLAGAGCVAPEDGGSEPQESIGEEDAPLVVEARHDHTQAPEEQTFELTGEGPYDLLIQFESLEEGRCADEEGEPREGDEALVTIYDPDGVAFAQLSPLKDPVVGRDNACGVLDRTGQTMQAGTWTIAFTGTAPVESVVALSPSEPGVTDDAPPQSHL